MERKAFLDQTPPPGYVAGIGRGATGFTTSAEVGSASRINLDDDNSDNEGSSTVGDEGVLRSRVSTAEDVEADLIYAQVEATIAKKKRKSEVTNAISKKKNEENDNHIRSQFLDLKNALSTVHEAQWMNLPKAGDITKRNKRQRLLEKLQQRFYAAPDALLGSSSGDSVDFLSISLAKDKLLGLQLDQIVGKALGNKTITVEDIDENADSELQLADTDKGRKIFASLRKSDPKNVNAWIASAKLERQANKYEAARAIIDQACRTLPLDEEVWLESIQIHRLGGENATRNAKLVVQSALKSIPSSEKLWILALSLEHSADVIAQKKVVMKALEHIPESVSLWRKLVEIEDDPINAKKLLSKAVELCPQEWTFWESLINLSTYEESKKIMNNARKLSKSSELTQKVWIAAIKLEERENSSISTAKLVKLLQKAYKEAPLETLDWLEAASIAEAEGFPISCEALVEVAIGHTSEPMETLLKSVETYSKEFPTTTAVMYRTIAIKHPKDMDIWMLLFTFLKANIELRKTDATQLYNLYDKAIELNPEEPLFWLMKAKDLWKLTNDVVSAKDVLLEAVGHFEDNEDVWFALIKLECLGQSNLEGAIEYLSRALKVLGSVSSRAWYKHIHLSRCFKKSSVQQLECLSDEALDLFPDCEKLYLQKAQILLADLPARARDVLSTATRQFPHLVSLWELMIRIDTDTAVIRARATLDNAISRNQDSPLLYVLKIRFEKSQKDFDAARQVCSKALRQFPNSAELWVENLHLISKPSQRKNAFVDALKATNNSPVILLNIAIFFWIEGKFSKADSWLQRSIKAEGESNGDCWAVLYKFTETQGNEEDLKRIQDQFLLVEENVNTGEYWNKLVKLIENLQTSRLEILQQVAKNIVGKLGIVTYK